MRSLEVFLNRKLSHYCAVCNQTVEDDAFAYLLTTNPAQNRLTILRWDRSLCQSERARAACEPEHVLEIVAYWMACGTLDLTFAQAAPFPIPPGQDRAPAARSIRAHTQPKSIGELTVNRETLHQVLENNPQALASILDSLLEGLQRDRNIGPEADAISRTPLALTLSSPPIPSFAANLHIPKIK